MSKNTQYIKQILFLLGDDKKKLPWLVLLFIFSSLLDLLGLSLIFSYISLIVDKELFTQSKIYLLLDQSNFISMDIYSLYIVMGLTLLIVFFVKSFFAIFINKTIVTFSFQKGADLRTQLMQIYQNLSYSEFLQRNSSEYIYNIQTLVPGFSTAILQTTLKIVSTSIVMVSILIFLAWTDVYILTLLFGIIGSYAVVYNRFFRKKLVRYGQASNKHNKLIIQGISEGISGLKEIRILGKEQYFFNIIKKESEGAAYVSIKSNIINTLPGYTTEFVMVLFVVLVVVLTILFEQNIELIVPTLGMFGVASVRLIPSANFIMSGLAQINFSHNSINILYNDFLNLKSLHKYENNSLKSSSHNFYLFELKNIKFTYQKSKTPVINNISFSIKSGDAVGFIGTSGSGKTTLIDIILGLLKPDKGEILFNEKPITSKEELYNWKSQIAYLPQEVFLIDDTLEKNIALGIEKEKIDKKQIEKALKQARLTTLVGQLPLGVKTMLGERGVRLSGGQCQRVALARAFYHNRSILIMDEATSSLDSETEKEIIDEIKRLKGKVTMIIIAHRYTTIEHCDFIYRIDNGRIKEKGSFQEVIKKSVSEK
jgi:ABC-type multidrug transport system fused ATPase/permease subunit